MKKNILLNVGLTEKIERYGKCKQNTYINDIFSYDEFKTVFKAVYMQFTFLYEDIMFTIFNCGDYESYVEFWIDGEEDKTYKQYKTPEELLNKARINDKCLDEIWASLKIA